MAEHMDEATEVLCAHLHDANHVTGQVYLEWEETRKTSRAFKVHANVRVFALYSKKYSNIPGK